MPLLATCVPCHRHEEKKRQRKEKEKAAKLAEQERRREEVRRRAAGRGGVLLVARIHGWVGSEGPRRHMYFGGHAEPAEHAGPAALQGKAKVAAMSEEERAAYRQERLAKVGLPFPAPQARKKKSLVSVLLRTLPIKRWVQRASAAAARLSLRCFAPPLELSPPAAFCFCCLGAPDAPGMRGSVGGKRAHPMLLPATERGCSPALPCRSRRGRRRGRPRRPSCGRHGLHSSSPPYCFIISGAWQSAAGRGRGRVVGWRAAEGSRRGPRGGHRGAQASHTVLPSLLVGR